MSSLCISTRLVCIDILPKIIDDTILVTESSSPNTHLLYSKIKKLLLDIKSLVMSNPAVILSTSMYLYLIGGYLSSSGTITQRGTSLLRRLSSSISYS